MPARECLGIGVALASALRHLHDQGLVHRDVKPSNVIFVHGVPKLADIGLVAAAGDSRSIVGTEGYLPPEGPGSSSADLYALGKLLYEASTGMNRQAYPRLPQGLREFPDARELLEFNEVLLRACAYSAERRYRRAEELLADLALLERGESVRRLRRLERHQVWLKRAAAAALAVGLVISAVWWQSRRNHRIAYRYLAQQQVEKGTLRMMQGDDASALPWLVSALQLSVGDATRERLHRTRIAGVLERCALPVACFSSPDSEVLWADVSLDGTLLATAHSDSRVRLWDVLSGEPKGVLEHGWPVLRCQFLPSGDRLMTLSIGQEIRVWDLRRGDAEPATFPQAVPVYTDLYSVGLNQGLQSFYLSKAPYCFARTNAFAGPFESLTLSLKLAGQGDALKIGYALRRSDPGGAVIMAGEFLDSPAADRFDGGEDTPAAPLWGRVALMLEQASFGDSTNRTGRIVWRNLRARRYLTGQTPPPWEVVDDFTRSTTANRIQLAGQTFRVADGQLVMESANLPTAQPIGPGVVWPGAFEIGGDHTQEVEVDLVRAEAAHPVVALSLLRPKVSPFAARDRSFLFHDRWLALDWWDGVVRIVDLESGPASLAEAAVAPAPIELRPGDGWLLDLDLRADGRYVVLTEAKDFTRPVVPWRCSVLELPGGDQVASFGLEDLRPTGARFSPDGRWLALSHTNGLNLVSAEDWSSVTNLKAGSSFTGPRFSLIGNRLAALREEREVCIWHLNDLVARPKVFHSDENVRRILFSPDGRFLAADTADGFVRVWDVVHGGAFGPPLPGVLVRFSADGSRLLLVGSEGGLWLWNLSRVNLEALAVPPEGLGPAFPASADGTMRAEPRGRVLELTTPFAHYSIEIGAPLHRAWFTSDNQYAVAETTDLRSSIWDTRTGTMVAPPRRTRYDATLSANVILNLAVEHRAPTTLADLSAVLVGYRPDGRGGVAPVGAETRVGLLTALQESYPEQFSRGLVGHPEWHRREAESSEREQEWDSAVFHWERAAGSKAEAASPDSEIPLVARLAYARLAAETHRRATVRGQSRRSMVLPRQPWAQAGMLDLTPVYTQGLDEPLLSSPQNSFAPLPRGVQRLGGERFDVRGLVDLRPAKEVVLRVGRSCQRIHFLHAADTPGNPHREPAGAYEVVYANGRRARLDLVTPENLPSYSFTRFHQFSDALRNLASAGPVIAWAGGNAAPATSNRTLFLFRSTWTLPEVNAGEIVTALELHAGSGRSAPLVFAITVE